MPTEVQVPLFCCVTTDCFRQTVPCNVVSHKRSLRVTELLSHSPTFLGLCERIETVNSYFILQQGCRSSFFQNYVLLCISVRAQLFCTKISKSLKSVAFRVKIRGNQQVSNRCGNIGQPYKRVTIYFQRKNFFFNMKFQMIGNVWYCFNLQAPRFLYIGTGVSLLSRERFLYI